jgi:DNA transformation protein
MKPTRLSELLNLGPKSGAMLASIGIRTRSDLAARGAIDAFIELKRSGQPASLNMLWALVGTLSGRDWRDVARHDRLRLLMELEARGLRL